MRTLQTIVAVVVLPTPGGPDNNAALHPEPSSLNRLTTTERNCLYSRTVLITV